MVDGFVAKCEPATVGGKMTVCSVELANGTLYAESSACVDPASYDEAVGKGICLDRAKDRVWHLLGFALQWARRGLPPAAAAIVAVMLLAGHVAAADLGSPIPIDKQVAELRADVDALKRDVAEIKGKPATASPPTWAGVRDRVAAGETVWIAVGVAPRLGDVALPARADVHPARHKCYRDAAGVERFECEDGRPSLVASRRVATAAPVMGPTFANPFGGPPSGCPGGNCAAPAGRLGRRW
nr:Gp49 family protein [Brasilonema bromeliae]